MRPPAARRQFTKFSHHATIRAMPKQLPPHLKIQRAKVIVDNEGQKVLMICVTAKRKPNSSRVERSVMRVGS